MIALSDERAMWQALADQSFRLGHAAGVTETAGYCATHSADLADAFTAGQQATAADLAGGQSAFAAGWAACLDRFADEIGGRSKPAHPSLVEVARWTRHAPRCRHGGRGGNQSCQRAGCLPGPRADFGLPAPWDKRP